MSRHDGLLLEIPQASPKPVQDHSAEFSRSWNVIKTILEHPDERQLTKSINCQQQTWARAQGQGGPMIVPIHPGRVNAGLQQGGYHRMPTNPSSPAQDATRCAAQLVIRRRRFHKNIYEEALHRSEEERHEYDFHVEATTRTITILLFSRERST
ncbi:hypothetical protein P692DRAFT_20956355 [Suillus brevipes Sb2]|nr:hypothetical protein P692DRAFT_20956355 [Suillus brevipes Sb2]